MHIIRKKWGMTPSEQLFFWARLTDHEETWKYNNVISFKCEEEK